MHISGKHMNDETKEQNFKIFHILNDIISFICKYESRIKANLDIPIKMSTLIKQKGREILNPDLKLKDIQKIIRWSGMMISDDIVDHDFLRNSDFIQYVQLLDKQAKLRKELKSIPSIAFGVEELRSFNLAEFKDCLDKTKRLKSKYEKLVKNSENINRIR